MRARAKVAPLLLASATLLLPAAATFGAEPTFTPRLQTPRVAPLAKDNRSKEQEAMLASRPDFNIYKTLAHDVDLYDRWSPLGRFILDGSSLPPREREIVMLRMGWLCQSEYEWAQHARIGKAQAGLSNQDIHRIAEGPAAAGWSDFERTLHHPELGIVRLERYLALYAWHGRHHVAHITGLRARSGWN